MQLKSVHQVFNNSIFRIPSYQRGYSWKNNKSLNNQASTMKLRLHEISGQLIDLWKDIINIPDQKWHYTGLLTLAKSKNKDYSWLDEHTQYDIVDGQQRITTILIILSILIEKASLLDLEFNEGTSAKSHYLWIKQYDLAAYMFGYDEDNPSDKYFRKHILGLDEIEDDSRESSYTENLINAKLFFDELIEDYMSKFSNEELGLQDLFDRITQRLKFNVYILPNELDEYVVFETMNNRGKPISELEKLKNRLMYLSDKIIHDDRDFININGFNKESHFSALKTELKESINLAWITIYHELGANKKNPIPDEDYIKDHWIMYFNNYSREESKVYSNFLFNEYFTIENVYNNKITSTTIKQYVKSLQDCSVIYNKIHYPDFFTQEESLIKPYIQGLHRVGFRASFKPLLLAVLSKKAYEEVALQILKQLEVFAFKTFYVSARKSNTGDSRLYNLAAELFRESTLSWILNELIILTSQHYDFSLFKPQIEKLFLEGDGYYSWPGLHYFLYSFDEYLRKSNNISSFDSQLIWKEFNQKKSIEHIYPQSAVNNVTYSKVSENWQEFQHLSPEQKRRLCHSLGNLLAISKSDNASFNNDAFVHKVDQSVKGDKYKNRGYRFDSFSAQLVAKEKEWTADKILSRGLEMIDYLLELLCETKIELSQNEKIILLGLDSVFNKKESSDD